MAHSSVMDRFGISLTYRMDSIFFDVSLLHFPTIQVVRLCDQRSSPSVPRFRKAHRQHLTPDVLWEYESLTRLEGNRVH